MMNQRHRTDTSRSDRFIETARALGSDEDEEAFRAKLRTVAKQRPKDAAIPEKPEEE